MSAPRDRLAAALAGRYRIERELGAGGMATVYLAEDLKHDRKVAIKVLKPELAAVLGAERFVVEIKTTASMSHPHILPLFDSGTAEGFLFYVMPYIQGETIREKLNRETQFGVDEAIRIAREVADALDYAHRRGVIHRDIKPENILLHDGRAMVMDFGIALAVSAAAGGRMTETGLSLGTPHYMSPEQATAEKEISPRSDVYSLASVLYEMLSGQPPHVGGSAQQVIMKIITEQAPPVTNLRKSVPLNVAAAVAKALEKLPADRFENAKSFADALGNPGFTSAGMASLAAGAGGVRALSPRQLVAAATLALAMGLGGLLLGRETVPVAEPPVALFDVQLPESTTAVNRCCGPSQVLSADGKTLVFVAMHGGVSGALYRRGIGSLESEKVPGTDDASNPALSPDGRWLVFEQGGQLKKVALTGGPIVPLAATGQVAGATWMTNDSILYSDNTRQGTLYVLGAAGGTPRLVPGVDSTGTYRYPSALPGNRYALAQWRPRGVAGLDAARVVAVDLHTGQVDTVSNGAVGRYASGHLLWAAADGQLFAQPFDIRRRRTTGEAVALSGRASVSGGSLPEFAVSDSGWFQYEVARGGAGGDILRIHGAGRDSTLFFDGKATGNFEDPAVSPDGNRIILRVANDGSASIGDLWMIDLRGRTQSRLTIGGGLAPVWNPSGTHIVYYVPEAGALKPGMYLRPVDQATPPQLLFAGVGAVAGSFTPDGKSVVFTPGTFRGGGQVGLLTLGDTVPKWLVRSSANERQPQISPDGKRLAFISGRTGRAELFVQAMSGDAVPVQVSTGGANSPRWSREGKTLLYFDAAAHIVSVTIPPGPGVTVAARTVVTREAVGADQNQSNSNWDVFPDGKRILYIDIGGAVSTRRIAMIQNWPAYVRQMAPKQ